MPTCQLFAKGSGWSVLFGPIAAAICCPTPLSRLSRALAADSTCFDSACTVARLGADEGSRPARGSPPCKGLQRLPGLGVHQVGDILHHLRVDRLHGIGFRLRISREIQPARDQLPDLVVPSHVMALLDAEWGMDTRTNAGETGVGRELRIIGGLLLHVPPITRKPLDLRIVRLDGLQFGGYGSHPPAPLG